MKRARTAGADYQAILPAPFALLGIRTEGDVLAGITFLPRTGKPLAPQNRLAARACAQIERYLNDPQFRFDLPLVPRGTEFQRRVWAKIAALIDRNFGPVLRGSRPATSLASGLAHEVDQVLRNS